MNPFVLVFLGFYLATGVFVCMHTYDKDNRPMPIHHFLLFVPFWPALFLLDEHDNGDGP